jgi:transcriptional regulator with XRE-family HTH domain
MIKFKYWIINDLILEKQVKTKGLTTIDIAKEMNISCTSLNTIKVGKSNPTVGMLLNICNYFQVGPEIFFENENLYSIKKNNEDVQSSLIASAPEEKYTPISESEKIMELQNKLIDVQEKLIERDEEITELIKQKLAAKNACAIESAAKAV